MNVKLKRKNRLFMAIASVALFVHVVVVCAASTREVAANKEFVWYNGKRPVTYSLPESVSPVVTVALDMFKGDMQQVTGVLPQKTLSGTAVINIIQLDKNKSVLRELRKDGIPVDSIAARKDAFFIKIRGNQLLVVGSDGRGTAYGILELSRLAGVSPWVWWGDVTPMRKERLTLPADYSTFQSPSVEYRGIFLMMKTGVCSLGAGKTLNRLI